jgi:hypothetical protein
VRRPAFIQVLIRSEPFRVFQLTLGVLLMLVAPIIGIPTPGPLGIFIFAFGLALVLRNSRWARRQYVRYTRRYPRVQSAVNFGLRRKSKRRPVPTTADALPPETPGTSGNASTHRN